MLNLPMLSRVEHSDTGVMPALNPQNQRAGVSTAQALRFDVIVDRAQFDALEVDWSALFAESGHSHQLFQSFNWNWHWCNHYLDTDNASVLSIVTARRNGHLVMVWPLVRQRRAGMTVLSWMGDPVTQYGDVLVEQGPGKTQLLEQGWAYVSTQLGADYIYMRKVRADAEVAPILAAASARTTAHNEAPYLDLTTAADFETYQKRFSKRSLRTRRRKHNRLNERGSLSFSQHTGGENARAIAIQAIQMKWVWLKKLALYSRAFDDRRIQAFFADIAEEADRPAGSRVSVLYSADAVAAIEISLICKGRAALHVIAYEMDFEQQSPGTLQLEASFERAFDQGLDTYDLLAPTSRYKQEWSTNSIAVNDHAVALSLRGRAYVDLYLCGLREGSKQILESLPAAIRRPLASVLKLLRRN